MSRDTRRDRSNKTCLAATAYIGGCSPLAPTTQGESKPELPKECVVLNHHSPKASTTELTLFFFLVCAFSPNGDSALCPCSISILLCKPVSSLARHLLPYSRA